MTVTRRRAASLALCLLAVLAPAQVPQRAPLTVMSFNIRYGTANDGENRWAVRKEFLIMELLDPSPITVRVRVSTP